MTIADKTVLITGANRGIGQALVEEALSRGAKRVYAGTRQPLIHPDERVTPLTLDVTNAAQIQAAVERIESLDLLINNAGVALLDDTAEPQPKAHWTTPVVALCLGNKKARGPRCTSAMLPRSNSTWRSTCSAHIQ